MAEEDNISALVSLLTERVREIRKHVEVTEVALARAGRAKATMAAFAGGSPSKRPQRIVAVEKKVSADVAALEEQLVGQKRDLTDLRRAIAVLNAERENARGEQVRQHVLEGRAAVAAKKAALLDYKRNTYALRHDLYSSHGGSSPGPAGVAASSPGTGGPRSPVAAAPAPPPAAATPTA